VELSDRRQQQSIGDGDEEEVPVRKETRAERERRDLRDPRDRRPQRGLRGVGASLLFLLYALRFPFSSYS
jgi:hypothetical protein